MSVSVPGIWHIYVGLQVQYIHFYLSEREREKEVCERERRKSIRQQKKSSEESRERQAG